MHFGEIEIVIFFKEYSLNLHFLLQSKPRQFVRQIQCTMYTSKMCSKLIGMMKLILFLAVFIISEQWEQLNLKLWRATRATSTVISKFLFWLCHARVSLSVSLSVCSRNKVWFFVRFWQWYKSINYLKVLRNQFVPVSGAKTQTTDEIWGDDHLVVPQPANATKYIRYLNSTSIK